MKKKNKLVFLYWVFALFVSLSSLPTQAAQCLSNGARVNAKNGFCITANLVSDGSNRIRIEGDYYYHPIWTDDSDYFGYGQGINETGYLNDGKEHQFQIKFVNQDPYNSRNIFGWLEYSVDGQYISSTYIDIRNRVDADKFDPYINVRVLGSQVSGTCLAEGNCGSLPQPEPDKEYSTDALYEFGVESCSSSSCTISLNNNYTITPLVFLMPTIDSNDPDDDEPATLVVSGVDKDAKTVTFSQKNPENGWDSTQMTQISYLVMEPGVADFNGKKVIAGYTDTQSYQAQGVSGSWQTNIRFSDWGGSFNATPVVLTQLQALNQNSLFVTSAISGITSEKVDLALELGRGSYAPSNDRRIAFLASLPGTGETVVNNQQAKFEFGFEASLNQEGSLTDSCQNLDIYYTRTFTAQPGVIAMKQTRVGGDGGWLRRCNLSKQKFSFVFDEDTLDSRRHGQFENIGFFAFEMPEPKSLDICEYVPDVVQSNKYYQGNVYGNLSVAGRSYVSTIDPRHGYSFLPQVQDIAGCKYNSTDGLGSKEKCAPVELKADLFPTLASFKNSENEFKCESGKPCNISPGVYKEVIVKDRKTLTFAPGEYWIKELKVENRSKIAVNKTHQTVIHFKKAKLEERASVNEQGNSENLLLIGHYDSGNSDDELEMEKRAKLYGYIYLDPRTGSFDLEKENAFIFGGVTAPVIELSAGAIIGTRSKCGNTTSKRYLVMAPTEKYALTCDNNKPSYTATMMLDSTGDGSPDTTDTDFNGPVIIEKPSGKSVCLQRKGSNTCLTFDSNNQIQENATNGVLELNVKPTGIGKLVLKASTSEPVENTLPIESAFTFMPYRFEVLPKSSAGKSDELIAGKPEDISVGVLACTTPEGGTAEYITDYQPSSSKPITVTTKYDAPLTGQSAVVIGKPFKFTDGKAELDKALSYNDAGKVTFTLKDPAFGKAEYCKGNSECEGLFPSGSSGLEGSATIYVRPYTFALCDIKNPDDSTPRNNAKDKTDHSGTSQSGPGFAKSGEQFEARLKPVIWLAGDSVSGDSSGDNKADIQAYGSGWCTNRKVTENYYSPTGSSVAIKAPVSLTIPALPASPATTASVKPEGGVLGGTVNYSFTGKVSDSGWLTTNLNWSEVGSLWLQADGGYQLDGRSLPLNQSTVQIGRFYPDHFAVVVKPGGSEGILPANGSFSYMEQPFTGKFTVKAMNNSAPVGNYHLFASSLQADFGLWLGSLVGGQYEAFDLARLHICNTQQCKSDLAWQGWGNVAQGTASPQSGRVFDATGTNVAGNDKPRMTITRPTDTSFTCPLDDPNSCTKATKADGPYQALDFRARVSKFVDGVDFVLTATEKNQHAVGAKVDGTDIRYGRMVLEDVGGRADSKIAIPLRVEYWDGKGFVTNTDDSLSTFDGDNYCKQIIAQSDSTVTDSTSRTSGQGTVTAGEISSGEFVAQPHTKTNYREQVELWQRLTSTIPAKLKADDCSGNHSNQPWLQYNWRQFGDESPSAVVTFGVYRGNDRIIYRGEKGMNQLLN
ncbi:DUF6701 domain-containing protein [Photobacterium proteolyticum]|nr:DUF6701 domain-containing protein [Photobacterium proteolyticum]